MTNQYKEYEIKLYRPKYKEEVVDVLQYLWGNDTENNTEYFTWKYEDNPYTEHPLGIVALFKGHVVGFRGYFATGWVIPDRKHQFTILSPTDLAVHPDHRLKGLSIALAKMGMNEFSDRYKIFLNMTSTRPSFPGYCKLGFFPLIEKRRSSKYSPLGIGKFLLFRKTQPDYSRSRIKSGRFHNVIVSDKPKPEDMAAVRRAQTYNGAKLQPLRDETFYKWRFNHTRHQSMIYFAHNGEAVTGYVVMRLTKNKRRGNIVDYAESQPLAIENILRFVIRSKHFDVISLYTYSIDESIKSSLKKLRFKDNNLLRRLEKRVFGELPLFVRPTFSAPQESDWFYEGLDLRKTENWAIKEICSDGI
jgi:hypothetical protein